MPCASRGAPRQTVRAAPFDTDVITQRDDAAGVTPASLTTPRPRRIPLRKYPGAAEEEEESERELPNT